MKHLPSDHNAISGLTILLGGLLFVFSGVASGGVVALKSEVGTFVVPVLINDMLPLDFTLDSGASEVTIPLDVFLTLRRTRTISEGDLLPSGTYVLADGSEHKQTRFRIRSLKVGDVELKDVIGTVTDAHGSLLLGQSFLSKFRSWSVDNERRLLLINDGTAVVRSAEPQAASIADIKATPIDSYLELLAYYRKYLNHGVDQDVISHGMEASARLSRIAIAQHRAPDCSLQGNDIQGPDYVINTQFNIVEYCKVSTGRVRWWYEDKKSTFVRVLKDDFGMIRAQRSDGTTLTLNTDNGRVVGDAH